LRLDLNWKTLVRKKEYLAAPVRLEFEVQNVPVLDRINNLVIGSIVVVAVFCERVEQRLYKDLGRVVKNNTDGVNRAFDAAIAEF